MPSVFKALASIAAWGLFVSGWLQLLGGAVAYGYTCYISGAGGPIAISSRILMLWGLGTGSLILSVCAMKLRQMLD
jgi:hypothetical protein